MWCGKSDDTTKESSKEDTRRRKHRILEIGILEALLGWRLEDRMFVPRILVVVLTPR